MLDNIIEGGRALRCAVFGAGGGIGSAFVRALCGMEEVSEVLAFSRTHPDHLPKKASRRAVDITREEDIGAAAQAAGELDLVIVATGMLHGEGVKPEKDWRDIDPASLARLMAVNTIGPALVLKHFAPLLPRERASLIGILSARVGSIGDNRLGGWYGYRASKAALNQIIRTFSIELARKRKHAILCGLHPGTVATGLSAPFRGSGADGVLSPDESAARLLGVLGGLKLSDSGKVFDWKGERVPD
jgi:NAD(P)-dependent dehydrogenase (short-subunit alcohol dehydrogenase family)